MSRQEIDAYLERLDEPARASLGAVRDAIVSIIPDAEECISYSMPAFRLHGKVIAGFAAFKTHLSYLPHSGSVLSELESEVSAYPHTKGALQFPADAPLPRALIERLIAVRMRQAFGASPGEP
jgi:uncharacterized protein YdhG (YjbR/CyaY superfamily)